MLCMKSWLDVCFFFFKQKTAYEIYQCDWSSDVCSSDLMVPTSFLRIATSSAQSRPYILNAICSAIVTLKGNKSSGAFSTAPRLVTSSKIEYQNVRLSPVRVKGYSWFAQLVSYQLPVTLHGSVLYAVSLVKFGKSCDFWRKITSTRQFMVTRKIKSGLFFCLTCPELVPIQHLKLVKAVCCTGLKKGT